MSIITSLKQTLAATLLSTAVSATAATLTFTGSAMATATVAGDDSCAPLLFRGIVSLSNSSGSSNLGNFQYGHNICFQGAVGGPVAGRFEIDFGTSSFTGSMDGFTAPRVGVPGVSDQFFTYTLTSGTGRFAGATGSFTNVGIVDTRGGPPSQLTFNFAGTINAPAVPEPASWAMMIVGFALVGGLARMRERRGGCPARGARLTGRKPDHHAPRRNHQSNFGRSMSMKPGICAVLAISALASAGPAAASTRIDFFPNIGPTSAQEDVPYASSPSFELYALNAIGAMLDGDSSRGGSIAATPTAFERRVSPHVGYFELLSTEFASWRGNFAPTGAFAAERGTWWRLGTRVESDTPFNLTQLRKLTVASLFSDDFDMATQLTSGFYPESGFAPTLAVGIYFGTDGVRGTADDVVCDSAACDPFTQPLNLFAWRGHGQLDWIDGANLDAFYGGDKEALRSDWTAYLDGAYGGFEAPYFVDYTYTLTVDGTDLARASYRATALAAVPEPQSWAMLILGFGLVGTMARWRAPRVAA